MDTWVLSFYYDRKIWPSIEKATFRSCIWQVGRSFQRDSLYLYLGFAYILCQSLIKMEVGWYLWVGKVSFDHSALCGKSSSQIFTLFLNTHTTDVAKPITEISEIYFSANWFELGHITCHSQWKAIRPALAWSLALLVSIVRRAWPQPAQPHQNHPSPLTHLSEKNVCVCFLM